MSIISNEKEKGGFMKEALSGLTVALALVPEAIAFSLVAGVKPTVGLYAAFIMGFVTSLVGGRPGMVSGATGAIAVVLAPLVRDYGEGYLFVAVIVMGIIQMVVGLLKLGKFARIIPHPVMLGFVNGLAIVIFKAQLVQFKSIGPDGELTWMTGTLLYVTLGLVIATMAIIYFLPKLTKAVPSTLVAIVLITLASIKLRDFGIVLPTVKSFAGEGLAAGLPKFVLPDVGFNLDVIKVVLPFALTAAMVGLIESLLTLNLIDEITETRGQSNRECIGQGLANLVNGFFGGMGGCAMIGQSMINVTSGGRKRLSTLVASISLIAFVVVGSQVIEMIPLAALVGVMFMVVIGTFEWESLKFFGKIPRSDMLIIIVVTIITVVKDLAEAVGIGIVLSALIFAWEKGKKIEGSVIVDGEKKVYRLNGPIFFASIKSFKGLFTPNEDPKEVIIDFANSQISDHSAIEAIKWLSEKYVSQGKHLSIRHISVDCQKLLSNADVDIVINEDEDPLYHVADNKL